MQKERFDMRQDIATEELAAEGAVHCLAEQRDRIAERDAAAFEQNVVPRNSALHGLAVAIPFSISLWTAIAVLVWLLLR